MDDLGYFAWAYENYSSVSGISCLLDETFNKGAHFVLGFTEQVRIPNTNDWLEYFLDNINKGYNINEAIDEATDKVGDVFVIVGDKGSSHLEYRSELPLDYRGEGFQYLNLQ